jgi:hypothetical protein
MSMRLQEHKLAVNKMETTSALAQHAKKEGHSIDFDGMRPLAMVSHLCSRIVREAVEIEKRPLNLNKRDDGKRLAQSWKPVLIERLVKESGIAADRVPAVLDERGTVQTDPTILSRNLESSRMTRSHTAAFEKDETDGPVVPRHEDSDRPARMVTRSHTHNATK